MCIRDSAYFGPIIKAQSDASKQMMELSQRTADAMEQNFSDLFFDVMTGEFKSLGDYARAALRSIQRAAADVLGQIAKELIVKGIANLFTSGFAGGFGGGGFASAASLAHQGGIVGQTSMPTILAPSSLFANAPRLHSGLARDEFPAILQKGETVIPRNQAEASITNININAVDSKSFMDMVKRNPGAIITTVNQHLADGGPLRNTIREAI